MFGDVLSYFVLYLDIYLGRRLCLLSHFVTDLYKYLFISYIISEIVTKLHICLSRYFVFNYI